MRSRDDDRFGEPSEEVLRRRRARRRTASAALVALFLGGAGAAIFAERGYLDVREKGLELERVRIEHALQEKRVLDLKQAVGRLRDHRLTIERIARERLGYVKPGELTLVLFEDGDAVVDGP